MAGILSTTISGLLAYQRGLATASHNVANAETPGYSRQRVELATRPPQRYGSGFIGSGVQVTTVRRQYDEFLDASLRESIAGERRLAAFVELASQVDDLLADPEAGVSPALARFFGAVEDLAGDPSSMAARRVVLGEARTLAARVRDLDARLADLERQVNRRLETTVAEINTIAQSIAKLNTEIIAQRGAAGGQPPNDLLDRRDELVRQLAERVAVTVAKQDDGAYNVFIGKGQALVVGGQSATLATTPNGYDASRLEVSIQAGASTVEVSALLSGGELGGLLDVRAQLLDPARAALGRVAVALAERFNAQHREGMDLNGSLGGDFFRDYGARTAAPHPGNTGTASVSYEVTDVGELTTSDYLLSYDGSTYTLKRLSDGTTTTLTGFPGSPATVDGVRISLASGAMAAGDRFLLRPTRGEAGAFAVVLDDPAAVAAAAPVRTEAALANAGTAAISAGEVLDATDPDLLHRVRIEFTSATTFDVIDETAATTLASGVSYTSGANIDYNGWRVQITGTP
ncbi:MAG TPA: flagellar hook-associated protein FlgK, partial [Chromatiales bacterium]|nr:flagellar hook-associated protein FlgK [Chromatiales bacterium]